MGTDSRAGPPGAGQSPHGHPPGRHAAPRPPRGPGRRSRSRPRPLRVLWLLVTLTLVGITVAACLGPRVLDARDQDASGFSLPGLRSARDRVSLGDYAGKPVIINFFASWSPPCAAETQLLAHFYRYYHGQVLIIGVASRDDRAAALRLVRQSLVTYPVATDQTLQVAARYGVPGIPSTYFLNSRHQVVRADYGWLSWKKLRYGVAEMDPSSPAAKRHKPVAFPGGPGSTG
jgi:cytochrome c biogenesis protein CcmG, thiol:disulfide interchange protein DsbE